MLGLNEPLYTWRSFDERQDGRYAVDGNWAHWSPKKLETMAKTVVSGLSSDEVVVLVAQEWSKLPSHLRMAVTAAANERRHTGSGSQKKGILQLDKLLGGKVLSATTAGPTERKLKEVDGRVVSVNRPVNGAVAAAERAFAAHVRPAEYNFWSPAEKRRFNQEAAAARRAAK